MLTLAIIFNAGFGVFHLLFWRLFSWPASLAASGAVNAGIMQVLNLCLTFVFFAAALAMAASAQAGISAAPLLLAGCVFWGFRAALQPIYFPMRHPASIALVVMFLVGSAIHGLAYLDG